MIHTQILVRRDAVAMPESLAEAFQGASNIGSEN
jgi:hypothetical protein